MESCWSSWKPSKKCNRVLQRFGRDRHRVTSPHIISSKRCYEVGISKTIFRILGWNVTGNLFLFSIFIFCKCNDEDIFTLSNCRSFPHCWKRHAKHRKTPLKSSKKPTEHHHKATTNPQQQVHTSKKTSETNQTTFPPKNRLNNQPWRLGRFASKAFKLRWEASCFRLHRLP